MASRNFVHLHVHSEYSLLDGACRLKPLLEAAAAFEMPALALTDHGAMYGVIEFYKTALIQGIKPLLGCEVYVAPRSRHDRKPPEDTNPFHLVLLAENQQGYQNLVALVSRAYLEGFYYKPRVDKELLAQYAPGLIALSGCLAGEVPSLLLQDCYPEAKRAAATYQEIFGKENFFLELQDHGLREQVKVNPQIEKLAQELQIPLVATNDVHYIRKDQAQVHDILLCIQTGKNLEEGNRLQFPNQEFYFKSPLEMEKIFANCPEALANTWEIAQRCQVDFEFGQLHLPAYQVPRGHTLDSYLAELCRTGLRHRGKEAPEYLARLEYELKIIREMNFSGYFLIVWDLVSFARQKKIFVGPGRGSAAGSLVAYSLGITSLDPIAYGLLFERFLNPERVTMPDIDIDFCFERRDEVIRYLEEKYGEDHVAQIVTFGTMAARAVIRDVGRAMNISLPEVDRIAKLVPNEIGMTLERALEISPELREAYQKEPRVQELIRVAQNLEGMPRHASTHAAGVVISPEPLVRYLPLQKISEGTVVTQFPMQTIEELGLLKLDVLGLRTLTVIRDTLQLVAQHYGKEISSESIPTDDAKTYQLLAAGETRGVFQLESPGMRNLLKNLQPERLEEIIALIALYRPGPLGSGMVEDFIRRKQGITPATSYLHPKLEPILRETFGVIVYQEQVMRIASELAGFSPAQADLLRRAMGKKKPEVIAGQRKNFIEGAAKNDVAPEVAAQIFERMEYFAGYGFNRSHSAAYALLAYQTAYLKANYPQEFMAALLTSVANNPDKVPVYIEECRHLGIKVLPPDVNESLTNFTIVPEGIRFGLAAVKNAGKGAIEAIIQAREKRGKFSSLQDFCSRVDLRQVNKRVIESLIRAGAFDSLNLTRAGALSLLDSCLEIGQHRQRDRRRGQVSFFDFIDEKELGKAEDGGGPEFPFWEILAMEKAVLGFYVSGHPAAEYQKELKAYTTHALGELEEVSEDTLVTIGGVITALRRKVTKKGEVMAVFTLEDTTGGIEVFVFPKTFLSFANLLQKDTLVFVEGRVNQQEEQRRFFAEKVWNLEHRPEAKETKVYLLLGAAEAPKEFLLRLRRLLRKYPGSSPVYLCFPRQKKYLLTAREFWVEPGEEFQEELAQLTGKQAVIVKKSL